MTDRQKQYEARAHELLHPMAQLVTIQKAMTILDIGQTLIYEMMNNGTIGTVRIGGRRQCRIADVERIIEHGYERPAKQGEAA